MEKRSFWWFAAVAMAFALWTLAGPAAAAEFKLKLAHNFLTGQIQTVTADEIAADVAKITNGRVEITTYPAGQLGEESTVLSMLQTGTIDIGIIGVGEPAKRVGALNIIEAPFLFRGVGHVEKLMDSGILAPYEKELLDKAGVRILAYAYLGSRNIVANFKVDSTADLKGKKFRVPNHAVPKYMATYLMGSVPTAMNMSETYLALQQGVIDLVEGAAPIIDAYKFPEIAKFYSLTRHQMPSYAYIMSDRTVKKMPADLAATVMDAVKRGGVATGRRVAAEEEALIKKLDAAGLKTHIPADPDSFKANLPVFLEKIVADGIYPAGLYEKIAALK